MKKFLLIGIILSAVFLFLCSSASAQNFTVTMPAGQSVTMDNSVDEIVFTVTNTHATQSINRVIFTFPAATYYVAWDTTPPSNWTITFNNNAVTFNAGTNIAPGASLDFTIRLKGPSWANIPSANSDTTDTLTNVQCRFTSIGTQTRTTGLPTWLRRSLALTIVGYPDAVGIGQTFSVVLLVENRSLQSKNGITATPSPPTPTYSGGAGVTLTGGPVYDPNPLNLNADTQGTITYTYRADTEGTVYFTAGVQAASATSKTATSNIVVISTLTAHLTVSPTTVVSGQNVTVTMTVQNTGLVTTLSSDIDDTVTTIPVASTSGFPSTGTITIDSEQIAYTGINATNFTGCTRGANSTTPASHSTSAIVRGSASLGTVTPSLSVLGTATATLVSGPTPAYIDSLSPGESGQFQWVYRITGSSGQTYQFQGSATALGSITSNTALSETGSISLFSITTSPDSIPTGSTNVTLSFTIYNNSASQIRYVYAYFFSSTWGGFYQNASVTCSDGNNNWSRSSIGAPFYGVRFTASNTASRLTTGENCTFNINFSAVPAVTADTDYTFAFDLYNNVNAFVTTLQGTFTITAYTLTLGHAPSGPLNADGTSEYTMTATLTAAGSPLSGKTVVFSATAGTLSAATAVTNASGQAVVTLTAPVSQTDISSKVTVTYIKSKATDTVQFTGVIGPNMQYVGGTLDPMTVCTGNSYTFTLEARNDGTSAMNLTTSSYFTFTDGSNTFTAYLDSPATVNTGATAALSFGSPTSAGGGGGVTIDSSFTAGSYPPMLYFRGTTNQTRSVSDNVVVTSCSAPGGGGRIKIIRWREVIQ